MNIWSATALNTAPDSENQIHGDDLAKEYGFEGGLVPGVTISAYLVHPLIELWGKDWLDRGFANCRITSPLYDNDIFQVKTDLINDTHANTTLIRSSGVVSANAEIALNENISEQPLIKGNKLLFCIYPNNPLQPFLTSYLQDEIHRVLLFLMLLQNMHTT